MAVVIRPDNVFILFITDLGDQDQHIPFPNMFTIFMVIKGMLH